MIDTFGREITYLRISITDRCNFTCLYCVPPADIRWVSHGEVLSYDEIVRVVRGAVAVGITKFRLTGGEPLMRRDVPQLVRMIREVRGVASVVMTTNGSLLAPQAEELRLAGLERINISLDTLRPDRFERITGTGDLNAVLLGIDAAIEAGFSRTKLNVVPMRGYNDDEIEAMVTFAVEKGLELRFIERMPYNRANGKWAETFVSKSEILERVRRIDGLIEEQGTEADGPAATWRLEKSGCRIGFIAAVSTPFCRRCNRLRLSATGVVRSCLVDGGEIDLREAVRGGATEEEMGGLLRSAALFKPLMHSKKGEVRMSLIGG